MAEDESRRGRSFRRVAYLVLALGLFARFLPRSHDESFIGELTTSADLAALASASAPRWGRLPWRDPFAPDDRSRIPGQVATRRIGALERVGSVANVDSLTSAKAAVASDGQVVAFVRGESVYVLSPDSGAERPLALEDRGPPTCVALDATGSRAVVGLLTGAVLDIDIATNRVTVVGQIEGPVGAVGIAAECSAVAATGARGTSLLRDGAVKELAVPFSSFWWPDDATALTVSPDAGVVILGANDGTLQSMDPSSPFPDILSGPIEPPITALAIIRGGQDQLGLQACGDATLRLWEGWLATAVHVVALPGQQSAVAIGTRVDGSGGALLTSKGEVYKFRLEPAAGGAR